MEMSIWSHGQGSRMEIYSRYVWEIGKSPWLNEVIRLHYPIIS
jgi:hypothetical protein